jgi:hypothetical protein
MPDLLDTLARAVADVQTIAREGVAQLRNELNAAQLRIMALEDEIRVGLTPKPIVIIDPQPLRELKQAENTDYLLKPGIYGGSFWPAKGTSWRALVPATPYRSCSVEIDCSLDVGAAIDAPNVTFQGISFANAGPQCHGVECQPGGRAQHTTLIGCHWPGRKSLYLFFGRGGNHKLIGCFAPDLRETQDVYRGGGVDGLLVDGLYAKRVDLGNGIVRVADTQHWQVSNSVLSAMSGDRWGNVISTGAKPGEGGPSIDGVIDRCTLNGRIECYEGTRELVIRHTIGFGVTVDATARQIVSDGSMVGPIDGNKAAVMLAGSAAEATGAPLMATLRTLGVEE